jgi:tRNA threonylcarbamoyladenosine biosynthesis protein TsaB
LPSLPTSLHDKTIGQTMRILAIETTGRTGSLAVLTGGDSAAVCVKEVRLDGRGRAAQMLAPALQSLLDEVAWPARSIELVAVAVGPGSFTGLRIGVTSAKTLAYAVGAQIVGVNTMAVLASQSPPTTGPLWTILDAQRQELFAAKFAGPVNTNHAPLRPISIIGEQAWLDGLMPGEHVTGPPLARLRQRLPDGVVELPEDCWQPAAAAVGQVAWRLYLDRHRDDVWSLVPKYYRPSAAEEKWGEIRRGGDKETLS